VIESLFLRRLREQFAALEQSSLRSDNFFEADSYLSAECMISIHCLFCDGIS